MANNAAVQTVRLRLAQRSPRPSLGRGRCTRALRVWRWPQNRPRVQLRLHAGCSLPGGHGWSRVLALMHGVLVLPSSLAVILR